MDPPPDAAEKFIDKDADEEAMLPELRKALERNKQLERCVSAFLSTYT